MVKPRWEVKFKPHQKKQQLTLPDTAKLLKWMIFKPQLIRHLMKVESKGSFVSEEDKRLIIYYLFKDGQH